MENKEFDIQSYMTKGVERVVKDAIFVTSKNKKEKEFMLRFASASKRAGKYRARMEKEGEHIPPFLIASVTSSCNLHCAGCYSRCNDATTDEEEYDQLTGDEWGRIFNEAEDLGISFILIAGGEPLLRQDVIRFAGKTENILFPIFTNGVFMTENYLSLFDECRNLIPIMSIEGDRKTTDDRRGEGVYDRLINNMDELNKRGLIFGASVTVTKDNLKEVVSESFLDSLSSRGCKAVIFVEFVPVDEGSEYLAPGDYEREFLKEGIERLRTSYDKMMFISFPGDEKTSEGCIAAGRGFFHINSHGGAEPCPFSPYSDVNIRNTSLRDAINSKLFMALQTEGLLMEDHKGGCVLHEKKEQVMALL